MDADAAARIDELYYASRRRRRSLRIVGLGVRLGAVAGGAIAAAAVAVEFFGRGRDLGYAFLLVPLLSLVVLGALALFLSPLESLRNRALTTLVVCVVATPFLLAGFPLVSRASDFALERLIRRSEPLVAALRAFEARHGQPPPNLDALVPEFLPSLPATGVPGAPNFSYELYLESETSPTPWRLGIALGGVFDFDELVLTSDGQPRLFDAFSNTRIGEWMLINRS